MGTKKKNTGKKQSIPVVDKDSSDKKAQEILNKLTVTDCDSIIPRSSFFSDDVDGEWTCGSAINLQGMKNDARLGGHVWTHSKSKGVIHYQENGKDVLIKNGVYLGKCTSSVAGHLISGGVKWKGNVGWGWEMRTLLPQYGFRDRGVPFSAINNRTKMDAWCENHAKIGDICCMTHGTTTWSRTEAGAGHACIFNGKDWVSDCIQPNGALCYNTTYSGVMVLRHKDCHAITDSSKTATEDTTGKQVTLTLNLNIKKSLKSSRGVLNMNGSPIGFILGSGQNSTFSHPNCDGYLKNGTYNIQLERCKWLEDKAKKNDTEGVFLQSLKGKVKTGEIWFPMIKNAQMVKGTTVTTKNDIQIRMGQGTIDTYGSLILGESNGSDFITKNMELYFKDCANGKCSSSYMAFSNLYEHLVSAHKNGNTICAILTVTLDRTS